ncbi:unnamed protein product, partial [Rotaria magnacalcarata]
MFSTDQQLNLLFNNDGIFADGNFSSAPKGFPVVFCLLPNRRITTYVELSERLKQAAIAMNPILDLKR